MNESSFVDKISELETKHIRKGFVKKILVFDELSSTNSAVKDLAIQGEGEGTLVLSQVQKKGRGRFERIWESPAGGLYVSLLLRPSVPQKRFTLLPLLAALAVAKTIRQFQLPAAIKWPNDVRIQQKKVAGILLEAGTDQHHHQYIVVGIGVNVNTHVSDFSPSLAAISTSLFHETKTVVDIALFFDRFLTVFAQEYARFCSKEYDSFLGEWKQYSDTLGRRVKIVTSSGELIGNAYDIDTSGFLIIRTAMNEKKTITSGDCLYLDEV